MNLTRTITTRDRRRLTIIHHLGPAGLLNAVNPRTRFTCMHSVLSYINRLRANDLVQGDIEDLASIELTDMGLREIGE